MTQQEVIKTFMQSLDNTTLKGGAALNEAIKASSKFKSFKKLREQFLNDLNSAENWHRFLVEKCGIILDNTDTGALSGSDAGGSKIKTPTDILPSKGKLQPYPTTSSVTIRGMTLYGIPPKDTLTKDQQYVVRGLVSWWLNDALKLIEESYGLTFTEEGTTGSRLKMQFINDEEDSGMLAYVAYGSDDKKIYEAYILCVNMAAFKNMSSSDHHGSTGDGDNLDRTIAHELVHGLMASNVDYMGALPGWLIEGGTAELIHGVDDERHNEIIEFVKDPAKVKEVLTTKSIEDYAPYEMYAGGYVFMRYLAKQAATDTTFDYDTYRATVSANENNFATNYWDTVTISGGSDADTITNSGSNVSIYGGKGNDTIKNYSDTVTVNGGKGNDTIYNDSSTVKIYGGKGQDDIDNEGAGVTISGGSGNDSISNVNANVSINGGSDNDLITNRANGKNSAIDGGKGNDSITNSGANSTVYGGAGNDSIQNNYDGKNSVIDGGSGKDSITNHSEASSITGGSGKDSITNKGKASSITGGTGNDVILNTGEAYNFSLTAGSESTLRGGDGKDFITNHADKVTIYGDAGNDKIANYGESSWVQGGEGNDSILNDSTTLTGDSNVVKLKGTNSTLRGGNGNDSITNTTDSVSVYGDGGNDYIHSRGDKVKLYGGKGDDLIYNYPDELQEDDDSGSENTVYGGAGNDTVISCADSSKINLGSGDDSIQNFANLTSIAGNSGNDYIYSSGGAVTLTGGSGNDYFCNEGFKVTILGGKGNDTLHNKGNHVTLSGGAGNDTIENAGGAHITYNFGKGYGKDTVIGFNADDTVQITSGKYSSKKSGSDIIVKVGNSSLTLVDAVGKKINFISSSGAEKSKTYSATAAKLWFDDDTDIETDNDLSAIVQDKSEISTDNFSTSLTDSTPKTLLTYSGKKSIA